MPGHPFPPMASGRIPVFGHTIQFLRDPIPLIEQGYCEHGPVSFIKSGKQST